MPLHRETLRAVAQEVAHISLSDSDIDKHIAALETLVREIDQLRLLPLKDCEPPFIFVPMAE
jgi:hypothetical protein